MELTAAHLRYLLAIYEVSQTHLDICSRSIAEKLNVTKPSVVRIMNLLMDRGMIVKEHYGKIYLTDRRTPSAILLRLIYWKAEPIYGQSNVCSDMNQSQQLKSTPTSTAMCLLNYNTVSFLRKVGQEKPQRQRI